MKIYFGTKIDLEFFTLSFYFILIAGKYYDNCMTTVVDCMGNPIASLSPITNDHFILVALLMAQNVVESIAIALLKKVGFSHAQEEIISFNSVQERIFYVVFLVGTSMNMGLPGLFALMNG